MFYSFIFAYINTGTGSSADGRDPAPKRRISKVCAGTCAMSVFKYIFTGQILWNSLV